MQFFTFHYKVCLWPMMISSGIIACLLVIDCWRDLWCLGLSISSSVTCRYRRGNWHIPLSPTEGNRTLRNKSVLPPRILTQHVCHCFCPFHWFYLNIHFHAVLISVLASCPHEALHKYTVFVPVWTADSAWWRPVRPAGCWRWWKCTTPQQGDPLETRRPQIPTSDPEYTSGLQLSQWKLCRWKRRMGKMVIQ